MFDFLSGRVESPNVLSLIHFSLPSRPQRNYKGYQFVELAMGNPNRWEICLKFSTLVSIGDLFWLAYGRQQIGTSIIKTQIWIVKLLSITQLYCFTLAIGPYLILTLPTTSVCVHTLKMELDRPLEMMMKYIFSKVCLAFLLASSVAISSTDTLLL